MSHLYFVPHRQADRSTEPLDVAWLPNLHKTEEHVCGDSFFRSPAAIVQANGFYAALVPDLRLFARNRTIGHALDLRTTGTLVEAPRLSYGICPYTLERHWYTRHGRTQTEAVNETTLRYGFDLFYGPAARGDDVAETVAVYLWRTYGRTAFADVRPQVLPFEEYGRRYTYAYELPRSVRTVTIDGTTCVGIHNAQRRGANFHAWENDLHVAYGLRHYADKWRDDTLRGIADGILRLSLRAPRRDGAFPCIYNFDTSAFEGTLFWTARAADPFLGYDSAAMGVTAWWQLQWHEQLEQRPEILDAVVSYARFLRDKQLPSGAVPTYFLADLTPAKQLLESATTAISGAVLARAAALTGDPALADAAVHAGRFIVERIVPGLAFDDFEAYYSCSPKPLHAVDYWTGIRPHNNLSLQWAADHFLALYDLTGDDAWLQRGESLLSILSLYQQVWNPSHLPGYLFGGFGVMNTDSEWNDGRQARFVSTYADYYEATDKPEYLERAVAACRAGFALMDIAENHANEINDIVMDEGPGLGYAPENIHHGGVRPPRSGGGWTGLDWSSGGALAASADLERRFGAVSLDGVARTATPIDGVAATVDEWEGARLHLTVTSPLNALGHPYAEPREVTIKGRRLPDGVYTVSINGGGAVDLTPADLARGVPVRVP